MITTSVSLPPVHLSFEENFLFLMVTWLPAYRFYCFISFKILRRGKRKKYFLERFIEQEEKDASAEK